jgi:hypothetical protein
MREGGREGGSNAEGEGEGEGRVVEAEGQRETKRRRDCGNRKQDDGSRQGCRISKSASESVYSRSRYRVEFLDGDATRMQGSVEGDKNSGLLSGGSYKIVDIETLQ